MAEKEKNTDGKAPVTDNGLKKEVEELQSILDEKMLPREKSLKTGMIVRICCLIFAFLYCSFLYYMVYDFTADEAVTIARGHLTEQLPTMKAEAVQNMKESAPKVVETCVNDMINSLPDMRRSLQNEILATTSQNIKELETGLNKMCEDMLNESKTELDKMGTSMTTAQKVDRLSKELRVKMFEESRKMVDELSSQYSSKVREVTTEIKRLQTTGNLSDKEKHQKELLRISSKLMQMKLKGVNADFQKATEDITK